MKKSILILIPIFYFLISGAVFAHGGVSKNVGNAVVYLNQTPLSPLVGEKVELAFNITDNNFQPLRNTNVKLTLIDTFFDDASKDKEILTKNLKTDDNGAIVFEYGFPNSDFYDVELTFQDPVSKEADQTGFLVQSRDATKTKSNWVATGFVGIIGMVLGVLIGRFSGRGIAR
jgi:hypothetical protein